jgi:hypothetical protein
MFSKFSFRNSSVRTVHCLRNSRGDLRTRELRIKTADWTLTPHFAPHQTPPKTKAHEGMENRKDNEATAHGMLEGKQTDSRRWEVTKDPR